MDKVGIKHNNNILYFKSWYCELINRKISKLILNSDCDHAVKCERNSGQRH